MTEDPMVHRCANCGAVFQGAGCPQCRLAAPAPQPFGDAYVQAHAAITEVIGCFEAAYAEGLRQALAETNDERLKDLVQRRLLPALEAVQASASESSAGTLSPVGVVRPAGPMYPEGATALVFSLGEVPAGTVLYTASEKGSAPEHMTYRDTSGALDEVFFPPLPNACTDPTLRQYAVSQMQDHGRACAKATVRAMNKRMETSIDYADEDDFNARASLRELEAWLRGWNACRAQDAMKNEQGVGIACPDKPGVYAWWGGESSHALVLVDRRPSEISPGGVLNGHVLGSSRFYDGCPVTRWGRDGKWSLLRAFQEDSEPSGQAPLQVGPLTSEEVRQAIQEACASTGPSDAANPAQYVMAGAVAIVKRFLAPGQKTVPPITPDEARWVARTAERGNGHSSGTSPEEYVIAGAAALARKFSAFSQETGVSASKHAMEKVDD